MAGPAQPAVRAGVPPPVTVRQASGWTNELDYDPPWAVDTDPGWRCMIRSCGANTTTKPTRGRTGWGGA
eukprot:3580876-Rhodomonas_salina.1